jgi:hypothetical protein
MTPLWLRAKLGRDYPQQLVSRGSQEVNVGLCLYFTIHRDATVRTKIRKVCAYIRPLYTIDTILNYTDIHKQASQSTSVSRVGDPNEQNRVV